MPHLTYDQFKLEFSKNNVVSLVDKLMLDAETPITIFDRFKDLEDIILLESISEQLKNDRYSYIGMHPYKKISCTFSDVTITDDQGVSEIKPLDNVYELLQTIQSDYQTADGSEKFTSGLMGCLTYECVTHLEKILLPSKRDLNLPLAYFFIPKTVLIFDNHKHVLHIVRNVFKESVNDADLESTYRQVIEDLECIKKHILTPLETPLLPILDTVDPYEHIDYECNVSDDTFIKNVNKCLDYIKKGDIFQIQVSRRAKVAFEGDPFTLYRYVRNYNPSPFLFFLKMNDVHLIGASPEILVNVEDNKMIIKPLAGTRKRYSKDRTETEIMNELVHDEKEIAEHIMLVDLARNDIGRACKLGSVEVTDLLSTEKYAHVIHMVSEVVGELNDGLTNVDAFKYGFPAGTVTGTPKIRAMEIISELENEQREFYSGGVAYFDFKGDLKSALTIRSMVVKDGYVYTQAAGGIVADSIPEMELKETRNKMRSCLSAMHQLRKKVKNNDISN